mgnify:CR=1 FL=1|jgi:abortive infection bacteriophage resistance protein
MDKVFKTYDEQIALLNSRGIEILTAAERREAKKALQHYGYYIFFLTGSSARKLFSIY